MAGLEKIIEEILNDGRAQAEEKRKAAGEQAEEIRKEAREKADQLEKESAAKAENDKAQILERAQSSGDMQKRQSLLRSRQQLIEEVLNEAYEKILHAEEESYFLFLENLLAQHALAKEGLLYLNEQDRKRLPADFAQRAEKIATEKGGSIRLAEDTRKIDGGFVLVYGGIEENCSLSALFRDQRDELADLAGSVLFA